jgi:putative redox protein
MNTFNITFPGNKRVDVIFNKFELKTDQKIENGGDETAPEPFELFLSALGACAGIYAKSFCDFRKLSTEGMHLSLEPVFKEGQKLMDQINMTLYVNQGFPEKYIRAIITSMNGCAVKNQLHPDIKAKTTVAYLGV